MDISWQVVDEERWEACGPAGQDREEDAFWDEVVAQLAQSQVVQVPCGEDAKRRRSLVMRFARQAGKRNLRLCWRFDNSYLLFRRDDERTGRLDRTADLRGRRALLGMSQAMVAQRAGISVSQLSAYENQWAKPTDEVRTALESALAEAEAEMRDLQQM